MSSTKAEVLPLLATGVEANQGGEDGAAAAVTAAATDVAARRGMTARIASLTAVMVICGAVVAVSTTFGSEIAGQVVTVASLGRGRSHHSSSTSSHHSSKTSSHVVSKKGDGKGEAGAASLSGGKMGITDKCQNIEADNAAGTFQFLDKHCAGGSASVPGCVGESLCRFCQTSIVPSSARNEGWPMCPNAVCKEMQALGCKGEDANSKREVLWALARDKAVKHNEYVKGISVGKCATTPADRKLGRHQFSDASCKTFLGPGCVGGSSMCRFCQLDKGKKTVDWVTCPDVVCKKWKVKGGGCEAPLALVAVPPKHPPKSFDVKTAEKSQQKEMRDFIKERDAPAQGGGGGGGGGHKKSDGLLAHKTEATGDIVVDLLQSKDRGAHGVMLQTSAKGKGKSSSSSSLSSSGKNRKNNVSSSHSKNSSKRGRRLME